MPDPRRALSGVPFVEPHQQGDELVGQFRRQVVLGAQRLADLGLNGPQAVGFPLKFREAEPFLGDFQEKYPILRIGSLLRQDDALRRQTPALI
jgi:hypothetical protein